MIELLVVIGIIGLLIAMLLPAVQAAREASRRTDCSNRVRQLALATHMHHNAFRYFPPARYESRPDAAPYDQCGLETPTWLVRVMPFLEQVSLAEKWDLSKPWHQHSEKVRTVVPDVFLCPVASQWHKSHWDSRSANNRGWRGWQVALWVSYPAPSPNGFYECHWSSL